MQEISRFSAPAVEIVCTNSPSTSEKIPFAHGAGGVLTVNSLSGATQVQWYASPTSGVSPVPVYAGGAAVTTALTVGAHPFPDAVFGCHFVVPVVSGAASMSATITVKG